LPLSPPTGIAPSGGPANDPVALTRAFVRGHEFEFGLAGAMALGTFLPWVSFSEDFLAFIGADAGWWDVNLWGMGSLEITGSQGIGVLCLAIGYALLAKYGRYRGAVACAGFALALELWTVYDVLSVPEFAGVIDLVWGAWATILVTLAALLQAWHETGPRTAAAQP
jgi:hypothetical protein